MKLETNLFKSSVKNDTIRGGERIFEIEIGRDKSVKCCGVIEYKLYLEETWMKELITDNGYE